MYIYIYINIPKLNSAGTKNIWNYVKIKCIQCLFGVFFLSDSIEFLRNFSCSIHFSAFFFYFVWTPLAAPCTVSGDPRDQTWLQMKAGEDTVELTKQWDSKHNSEHTLRGKLQTVENNETRLEKNCSGSVHCMKSFKIISLHLNKIDCPLDDVITHQTLWEIISINHFQKQSIQSQITV